MTTSTLKLPRRLFCTDPAGLNVPFGSADVHPLAVRAIPLNIGDSINVTEDAYELSKDIHGNSWFDYTPDEQLAHWHKVRFAWDSMPEDLAESLERKRIETLQRERTALIQANPRLAHAAGASARLNELDRALKG